MQAGGKGRAGVRAVGAIGHEKFARQLWGREILSIMLIRALIPLRLDYFDNSTLNFSHASSGKTDSFNAFCWTVAALRKYSFVLDKSSLSFFFKLIIRTNTPGARKACSGENRGYFLRISKLLYPPVLRGPFRSI